MNGKERLIRELKYTVAGILAIGGVSCDIPGPRNPVITPIPEVTPQTIVVPGNNNIGGDISIDTGDANTKVTVPEAPDIRREYGLIIEALSFDISQGMKLERGVPFREGKFLFKHSTNLYEIIVNPQQLLSIGELCGINQSSIDYQIGLVERFSPYQGFDPSDTIVGGSRGDKFEFYINLEKLYRDSAIELDKHFDVIYEKRGEAIDKMAVILLNSQLATFLCHSASFMNGELLPEEDIFTAQQRLAELAAQKIGDLQDRMFYSETTPFLIFRKLNVSRI